MNIQDIERRHEEEDAEDGIDFKNPLPQLDPNTPYGKRWFDLANELDNDIITNYKIKNNITGKLPIGELGSILKQYRNKFTDVVELPILRLTSIEKRLNSKHLKKLIQGSNVESSSDLPSVYKMGNLYVVSDGNHRVAAAFINGEDTIKVRLLDMDKVWEYLNT